MAPPRGHYGGGGAVTRDRVIVVLFLGLMVGLGFGLASLQVPCRTLLAAAMPARSTCRRCSLSAVLRGVPRRVGTPVVSFRR